MHSGGLSALAIYTYIPFYKSSHEPLHGDSVVVLLIFFECCADVCENQAKPIHNGTVFFIFYAHLWISLVASRSRFVFGRSTGSAGWRGGHIGIELCGGGVRRWRML